MRTTLFYAYPVQKRCRTIGILPTLADPCDKKQVLDLLLDLLDLAEFLTLARAKIPDVRDLLEYVLLPGEGAGAAGSPDRAVLNMAMNSAAWWPPNRSQRMRTTRAS